jgi:hypothetical protein
MRQQFGLVLVNLALSVTDFRVLDLFTTAFLEASENNNGNSGKSHDSKDRSENADGLVGGTRVGELRRGLHQRLRRSDSNSLYVRQTSSLDAKRDVNPTFRGRSWNEGSCWS